MPATTTSPPESLLGALTRRTGTRTGESAAVLYCAAAFGAFCLGLGDLLNNQSAPTVLKLGEIVRQHLWPSLTDSGGVALLVLVLLGAGVCWLQQPTTRIDAFARGFSVFAILAVTTPHPAPTTGLADPSPDAKAPNPVTAPGLTGYAPGAPGPRHGSTVLAATWGTARASDVRLTAGRSAAATVWLFEEGGTTAVKGALVTLRDRVTARVIGSDTVDNNRVEIRKEPGKYWVEVEKDGYQRIRFELNLNSGQPQELEVEVPTSRVPLNLQRLGSAEKVLAKKVTTRRPAVAGRGRGASA